MWRSLLVALCFTQIASAGLFEFDADKKDVRRKRYVSHQEQKCQSACTCPTKEICDECEVCPRQEGEPCSDDRPCDSIKGLTCLYLHEGDGEGICKPKLMDGFPCIVDNRTYQHGETFSPDCRTQCACQNGTYGCSSLCPQEHISPLCKHPRLVEVPGQCCREWMCDSQNVEQPPSCQPSFTKWSECSSECGVGLSNRRSNLNGRCDSSVETRLCQLRSCQGVQMTDKDRNHHLRKGHECKATHRLSTGVHFRFGPCISRKRFRPKFCGKCSLSDVVCKPLLSTTVRAEFWCDVPSDDVDSFDVADLLPEFLEAGDDLWADDGGPIAKKNAGVTMTVSVQWILKCSCDVSENHNVLLHRVHRTAIP